MTGVIALTGCAPKPAQLPAPESVVRPDTAAMAMPPLPEPYGTRTLRSRSNLRTGPSPTADLITTLDAGTPVGLLSVEKGWYNVLANSTTGWVWAPLVNMTADDRWDAALSAARSSFEQSSLFVATFRDDHMLKLILDIAWRDMTKAQKERIVTQTGEAWKRAAEQMGLTPAPEIRFYSNNDVEMARWHAFWGTQVKH